LASFTREQLEKWVGGIDVKADRVLDVGGSQYPIKGRTKSWDVKDYKILDLKDPHVCKQGPDIAWNLNVDLFDSPNNPSKEKLIDLVETFDIAFCLEVFEYIWRPYVALKNINYFLKPGGTFYSSWHFIYPHHNPEEKDYLRYTKWGVAKLLKEAGFGIEEEVLRLEKGHLRERGGIRMKNAGVRMEAFYTRERMRPCKEFKEHHAVGWLVKAKKITK